MSIHSKIIHPKKKIHEVIQNAIFHIKKNQQPCGNFLSLSSPSPADFSGAIPYTTTFFTSNILSCLGTIDSLASNELLPLKIHNTLKSITIRGAEFLLSEKSNGWSFNYFTHNEHKRTATSLCYPDDLDDTFAALIALQKHNPQLISGDALAAITKLLIGTEVKEGGPYRTWIISPNTKGPPNDPDIVVNSTVGYFLSLLGVPSPRISEYLTDVVRQQKFSSPYYPGFSQVAYFLSRYLKEEFSPFALPSLDCAATPLESAMIISTYFHCRQPEKVTPEMVKNLINAVDKDGWQPYPFCMDPAQNHVPFYAGSSALTAAFVAEALARCMSISQEPDSASPLATHNAMPTPDSFHRDIQNTALRLCALLPQNLRETIMEKIENTSGAAITAPSHEFQKILESNGCVIPEDSAEQIALASFYGWIAYDIYDDFLDNEGHPSLLPIANYFLRKLTQLYAEIAACAIPHAPLTALFNETINAIDEANAWEVTNCRILTSDPFRLPATVPSYGNYDNLANRSIGYAMGPLAELLIAGYLPESPEYRATESLFRHYLIARQLHDDAHDWESDLIRGSINSIGALLIDSYRTRFPEHARAPIAEIIRSMREFFWKETVDRAVKLIHAHIKEARAARDECKLFHGTEFMEDALAKLERGATRALSERDRTLEFITSF
jgi:hypothetical protein